MEIKITKRQKLYEQHNDMISNYYYLVYGKIFNDNNTKYKKFKFVIHFDGYDLAELEMNKEDYLGLSINNMIEEIVSYENTKRFYELCNKSINDYNDLAKHWY